MRRILLILILACSYLVASKYATEQIKENFFKLLNKDQDGQDFLSYATNHIMKRAEPIMKFYYGTKKATGSISDWLECQSCKTTVFGLDIAVKSQIITNALEEFGVLVCN
jgi:hypothetical protein